MGGRIQRVVLEAMGTDAWLFTKFAVKTFGWQHFGCANRWLDGKPYNTRPYGLPSPTRSPSNPLTRAAVRNSRRTGERRPRGAASATTMPSMVSAPSTAAKPLGARPGMGVGRTHTRREGAGTLAKHPSHFLQPVHGCSELQLHCQ